MPKIKLSKRADEALSNIPSKHARQIATRISVLARDPAALPSVELKESTPWRRISSGAYRIIYRLDGDTLHVGLIAKRNDNAVYRISRRSLR